MINSPYDKMGGPKFEDVPGSFLCQTHRCYSTVFEAKYNRKEKLLTWLCENGHKSHVENFEYEDDDDE